MSITIIIRYTRIIIIQYRTCTKVKRPSISQSSNSFMQECCDARPIGCCRRSRTTTSLSCAIMCICGIGCLLLPFASGIVRCISCSAVQNLQPPSAPPPATPSTFTMVLVILVMNAGLGLCIGCICVGFFGDADGACALAGSEKKMVWCLSLSTLCGLPGLCVAASYVWAPSAQELCCVPPAEQSREKSERPTRAHAQAQRPPSTGRMIDARPIGRGYPGSGAQLTSGYV